MWGLWVKGLQSCCVSNFEKDLILDAVDFGLTGSKVAGALWELSSKSVHLEEIPILDLSSF